MRYLVTGGCGFLGARLVAGLIAEGHEVAVIDDLSSGHAEALPPGARLHNFSVEQTQVAWLQALQLDGIFHLAATSAVEAAEADPRHARRVNVGGTEAILRAAAGAGSEPLPVVLASSAAVYGQADRLPIGEDSLPRPTGVYGASKLAAEQAAASAFRDHRVSSVSLRLFNVYGPWPLPDRPPGGVVAAFSRRMAEGREIQIHGEGMQQRDFVYIDDAVALLRAAMSFARNRQAALVVNGCTGEATSIIGLAEALAALNGKPLALAHTAPRAADITCSVGDPALAETQLGYRPTTPLRLGLQRTLKG